MVDKLQWFPRVITDMNTLESEFYEYQATPDDEFPAYFDKNEIPCALITFGTKYLKKLMYNLVNLVLNTLQNFAKFLLLILTAIHIVRVYLVPPERPALTVAIT